MLALNEQEGIIGSFLVKNVYVNQQIVIHNMHTTNQW